MFTFRFWILLIFAGGALLSFIMFSETSQVRAKHNLIKQQHAVLKVTKTTGSLSTPGKKR